MDGNRELTCWRGSGRIESNFVMTRLSFRWWESIHEEMSVSHAVILLLVRGSEGGMRETVK